MVACHLSLLSSRFLRQFSSMLFTSSSNGLNSSAAFWRELRSAPNFGAKLGDALGLSALRGVVGLDRDARFMAAISVFKLNVALLLDISLGVDRVDNTSFDVDMLVNTGSDVYVLAGEEGGDEPKEELPSVNLLLSAATLLLVLPDSLGLDVGLLLALSAAWREALTADSCLSNSADTFVSRLVFEEPDLFELSEPYDVVLLSLPLLMLAT